MLWLPKWLRTDEPPPAVAPPQVRFGGLSRREFIIMAGATGIAAATPQLAPKEVAYAWRPEGILAILDDGTYVQGYHAIPRVLIANQAVMNAYESLLQQTSRYTPAGPTWADLERADTWRSGSPSPSGLALPVPDRFSES